MTVKELIQKHHLTQTALSKRFSIPLRTVQNWCSDSDSGRRCPEYVVSMMDELLSLGK